MSENEIARQILDAGFAVHSTIGPGVLESVYGVVLAHELRKNGLRVERQKPMSIIYDNIRFDEAFGCDLVVEGKVIAELKSVQALSAVPPESASNSVALVRIEAWFAHQFWRSTPEKWHKTSY